MRGWNAAITLVLITLAPAVQAAESACTASYEEGQVLRKEGRLVEARTTLLTCAQETCHPYLRKDCAAWVEELDKEIPSIALRVRGPDGCDAPRAKATLDSAPIPSDGRSVEVNPGSHQLHVDLDGRTHAQDVTVTSGDRSRVIQVSFSDANVMCSGVATTAREDEPRSSPSRLNLRWQHVVGIGASVVGAAAIAYTLVDVLGYTSDESDLRARYIDNPRPSDCSVADASCNPRVNIKKQYADNEQYAQDRTPLWVGAGIGGLALLGTGITLLVLAPPWTRTERSTTGLRVHVVPTVHAGARGLGLVGTF